MSGRLVNSPSRCDTAVPLPLSCFRIVRYVVLRGYRDANSLQSVDLGLGRAPGVRRGAPEFSAEQLEFFEKEVRPLLVERCHKCHSATEQKGNLRLDSRAAVLAGGDTGPAIDAAKPQASELLRAINYDADGYQMPPDGKLPDAEIAVLTRWVEAGAPWPKEAANGVTDPAADWETEFARRMAHWSFQPLVRQAVPPVDDAAWCRNAIDRFVGRETASRGVDACG